MREELRGRRMHGRMDGKMIERKGNAAMGGWKDGTEELTMNEWTDVRMYVWCVYQNSESQTEVTFAICTRPEGKAAHGL